MPEPAPRAILQVLNARNPLPPTVSGNRTIDAVVPNRLDYAAQVDLESAGHDDILQGTSATDRMESCCGNDTLYGIARAPTPIRRLLLRQSRQSRGAAHTACALGVGSRRTRRQTKSGTSPDRRSQSRSPWQRGQEVAPLIGIGRLA